MSRYYITRTPLFALRPITEDDSRQVTRRKVIVQEKRLTRPWTKTGPAEHPVGPTPAKPARPKAHRWLS